MATDAEKQAADLKNFKTQPWILFDTIVSTDFRPGSATDAVGSSNPAISQQNTIVFFQGSGRTKASMPWYTNLDMPGQLSYGLEVWQIYFALKNPRVPATMTQGQIAAADVGPSSVMMLESTLLQFGELEVELGQENQMKWPLSRFGAGGGVYSSGLIAGVGTNARQDAVNTLDLAEPIQMPRTQNFNAVIRIAPEAAPVLQALGGPLPSLKLWNESLDVPADITVPQLPYSIELGFIGKRVKKTQYGQIAG
jgi:hypothetical protein